MKHFYTLILLFASLSAAAQTPTMELGYVNPDAKLKLTESKNRLTYYQYIAIPAAYTQVLDGCKVTAMKFAVGSCRKAPNTNFKLNITTNYYVNTDFVYQQEATITPGTATKPMWNTVELTTPYEIKAGANIYIGYQLDATQNQYPCAYAPEFPAQTGINDLYGMADSEGGYAISSTGNTNAIILTIEGEDIPAYDLRIAKVQLDRYGYLGYDNVARCVVQNLGSQPIDHIDFSYWLRYSSTDHDAVAGTAEAPLQSGEFAFFDIPVAVTDDMKGSVAFNLEVMAPQADAMPSNNAWKTTFSVAANATPRKVLMESLQSTMDATSLNGYDQYAEAKRIVGADNIIEVRHYYRSGDLDSPIFPAYQLFFYPYAVQLPAVMMDRKPYIDETEIPFTYPYPEIPMWAKEMYDTPAHVKIDLSNPQLSADGKSLSIDVDAAIIGEIEERDTYVNVFLIENNVVGEQKGAQNYNNFTHQCVFRASATGDYGEKADLSGGYHKTHAFAIDEKYDITNLGVVAFVSHLEMDNALGGEVLNATELTLVLGQGGVGSIEADKPEGPAEYYTIDGRSLGCPKSLAPGIYVVRRGSTTQKVAIQ